MTTAIVTSTTFKCRQHPTYKAARLPKSCCACFAAYMLKHPAPPALLAEMGNFDVLDVSGKLVHKRGKGAKNSSGRPRR